MGASGLRNAALVMVVAATALVMVAVSPCRADYAEHFAVLVNSEEQQSYFLQASKPIPFTFKNATHLDVGGRRVYSRSFDGTRVVVVKTGSGENNAALTTQLLLSLFRRLTLVVHAGSAGTPTPEKLKLADVVIVDHMANTGNLYWQRLNSNAKPGVESLSFDNFNRGPVRADREAINELYKLWYLEQQVVYSDGDSENLMVFDFSTDITVPTEEIQMESCAKIPKEGKKCLDRTPRIVEYSKTCSSNIYVDNAAYAEFLNNGFGCDTIDMASAGVALVCKSYNRRCASVKAISNTAGVPAASSDDPELVRKLNRKNLVEVTIAIIRKEIEPRLSMVV